MIIEAWRNQYATLDAERARSPRLRKCLDCPAMIGTSGGRKRCAACGETKRNKDQYAIQKRRRAKKAMAAK